MTSPHVARVLLAACTPRADYECVIGDLEEEYGARVSQEGRLRADRWYWSQALRSLPALLSYSRTGGPPHRRLSSVATVAALLIAMLAAKDVLDRVIDLALPHAGLPLPAYYVLDWTIAAAAGSFLAHVLRDHPLRLALLASCGLVAAFGIPIALDVSPPITPPAWILLLGTIPSMSAGAAMKRIFSRH